MSKSKVYFTSEITPTSLIKIFECLDVNLKGKVAVKLHSGEEGNQNYLHPEFMKPMIEHVKGTVVECNTAYEGARNTTSKHQALMERHGWSQYFNVDILDSEGPDKVLAIPNGKVIKKNYVGKNLVNYNSMLVLSHFKGHPMGGYGGAIKQLSIGIASSYGKAYIHGTGVPENFWTADHDSFLEAMADAASSVIDYLKGNILYINVMNRLSIDCDCDGNPAEPDMHDIGILASTDPVALDQACIDLIYAQRDGDGASLVNRIESLNGLHTLEYAEQIGLGSRTYQLISVDE